MKINPYKQIAKMIIDVLRQNRREQIDCNHHDYYECLTQHFNKLVELIQRQEKINFVLPAFPAKSPNKNKTFSHLPDLGERLALHFLNQLCCDIQKIYPPGANVIICSDGRVFNDLILVKDSEVNAYAAAILNILKNDALVNLQLFSLDNYYSKMSYENMRKNLINNYGEKLSILKNTIKNDAMSLAQFNGIHRFIFEDNLACYQLLSKNKIRNISKQIAYQVVQRSNAWSALVEQVFPFAIRLSIHPQLCGSPKIGIMLLDSEDVWATPWHRVLLLNKNKPFLIRKSKAEQLGATPIFIKKEFSHYIAKE